MIARPDSVAWTAAAAVGGRGESQVARWFESRGFTVENVGKIDTRRDLLVQAAVEVKTDVVAETSGRVAVEVEYHGRPSGLSISTASAWAFIVGKTAIVLPIDTLRQLVESGEFRRVRCGDNYLSEVVLIPLPRLKSAPGAMQIDLEGEQP